MTIEDQSNATNTISLNKDYLCGQAKVMKKNGWISEIELENIR